MNKNLRDKLERDIEKALIDYKAMRSQKYDGIVGSLPDWVPDRDVCTFDETQNNLVSKYGLEKLYGLLEKYRRYCKGDLPNEPPLQDEERLRFLDNLYFAVSKREYGGLLLLAGEDGVRGRRVILCGREGHELVHGTDEEKYARWTKQLEILGEMHRNHPRWTKEKKYLEAANEYSNVVEKVSMRTIKRAYQRNQQEKFTLDPFENS